MYCKTEENYHVRKGSKSSNDEHKFTRQVIEELLEDETTDAIDYDEDGKLLEERQKNENFLPLM